MSARHIEGRHGPLHWLFESTLLLKAVFAALEAAAGLGLRLVPNSQIHKLAGWLTHRELIEDPADPLSLRISRLIDGFSDGSQHFYAFYLMSHGLIKLVIVILLMRRIAFAYPLGIAVFAGFVVFQAERFLVTHSPFLLALTLLDLVVIYLTWREWRAR